MDIKSMKSRIGSVALFLVFLIALNYFASKHRFYFDLTKDRIYTISDVSKNIMNSLDGEVKVNFFISKDLPPNLQATKTQLTDLMNQYQDLAGSKLKVLYVEPENTPEKINELAAKGIPQIQVNVVERDKYEVKQGFFGVEIVSGDDANAKRESIPIIQSIDNWEYDFMSAVYSVSRDKKEVVAQLSGHNEKELNLEDLKKSYDIETVKIETAGDKKGFYYEKETTVKDEKGADKSETEKVFVKPITLLISVPASKIADEEISVIDEYVKNGGNVIVMAGSVDVSNNLEAQAVPENGLNNFAKKYGMEISKDLVYDASNSSITYQNGFFTVSTPYPLFVKAVSDNFSDDPSLSGIQSIVFPWPSSITLSGTDDYAAFSVISTTSKTGTIVDNFDVLPNRQFAFTDNSKKTIAAVSKPKDVNSKSGKVFVIGNAYFVLLNFSKQISDNNTFFSNLVDSVSNSVNLSSIRAKNIADRPIKDLGENEKNYWKFVAVLSGALMLDVYGVYRIVQRKKKMKASN